MVPLYALQWGLLSLSFRESWDTAESPASAMAKTLPQADPDPTHLFKVHTDDGDQDRQAGVMVSIAQGLKEQDRMINTTAAPSYSSWP